MRKLLNLCALAAAITFAVVALHLLVVRLEAAPAMQIVRFDGGHGDKGDAVALDSAGNTYVAGSSEDYARPASFVVVKHNAQGAMQWVGRYAAASGEFAGEAFAIGIDASGNTYAAGYILRTVPFGSNVDWLVVSFDALGRQRWAHRYDGLAGGQDSPATLVVDGAGSVYVSGFSGSGNDNDWLTIKYSSTGTVLWQRAVSGTAHGDDRPIRSRLDSAGNLVVLGYTTNSTVGGQKDITTVKYSSAGATAWTSTYTDTAQSDEMPAALAVDASGSVYVTGETVPSTNFELEHVPVTLKYSSSGQYAFIIRGDGAGGSAIVADASGSFIVSGASMREAGNPGVTALSKFTGDGQQLWSKVVDASGALVTDAARNVYLVASAWNNTFANPYDYLVTKLDSSGRQLWQQRIVDGDVASDVAMDAGGNLFITGTASSDMVTARVPADFAPSPSVLAPPSSLSATGVSKAVALAWNDNSTTENGFTIESCLGAGCTNFAPVAQVGAGVRTFTLTGLAAKTSYSFRVLAFNASGSSAYSNIATAKTANK